MSASGSMSQLTCLELVELITDYIEDGLSPRDRARFDEHLDKCEGCATYLEQMRETIKLTGALREDSIAPAARRELLAVFRDWRARG
jgi:anti-sigma factor RsiW